MNAVRNSLVTSFEFTTLCAVGEGAIINVERGRVRFREEAEGLSYELRPSRRSDPPPTPSAMADASDSIPPSMPPSIPGSVPAPDSGDGVDALDVYRLDENATNGSAAVFVGRLVHGRQGWRPEMTKRDRLREQLVVIARAWNRALVLKK